MKKTSRAVCPLVNRLSTYPLWRHSGTLAHAAASARVVNLCEPLFRPRRQILKVRRYAVDLRECWVASSNPTARPLHVSQRRIPRPRNAEEAEMAVGMLQTAEMFTREMYDQVTEKMFGHSSPMRPEESPEGLIVHSAGQGEGGW